MAKREEKVEQLVNVVEQLLPHIDNSKLNTQGRHLKKAIRQHIEQIKEETSQHRAPGTRETPTDAYEDAEDLYEEAEFMNPEALEKNLPASDRTDVTCQGKLTYRREKKSGNKVKYQNNKRWCVLRAKILYIYEKSSSKKQTECFFVNDYHVTPIDVEQTKKKKSFPFEMVQDGKKTYVFFAPTAADQKMWVDALNQVTGIARSQRPVTVIDGDLYDDVIRNGDEDVSDPDSRTAPDEDPDALYYDATATTGAADGTGKGTDSDPDRTSSWSDSGPSVPAESRPVSDGGPIQDPAGRPEVTSAEVIEPSYADMYYGVWDNEIQYSQELAFKRGDVITVLSREFEDKGWWVGRLRKNVGLVPFSYLTPAYQRV